MIRLQVRTIKRPLAALKAAQLRHKSSLSRTSPYKFVQFDTQIPKAESSESPSVISLTTTTNTITPSPLPSLSHKSTESSKRELEECKRLIKELDFTALRQLITSSNNLSLSDFKEIFDNLLTDDIYEPLLILGIIKEHQNKEIFMKDLRILETLLQLSYDLKNVNSYHEIYQKYIELGGVNNNYYKRLTFKLALKNRNFEFAKQLLYQFMVFDSDKDFDPDLLQLYLEYISEEGTFQLMQHSAEMIKQSSSAKQAMISMDSFKIILKNFYKFGSITDMQDYEKLLTKLKLMKEPEFEYFYQITVKIIQSSNNNLSGFKKYTNKEIKSFYKDFKFWENLLTGLQEQYKDKFTSERLLYFYNEVFLTLSSLDLNELILPTFKILEFQNIVNEDIILRIMKIFHQDSDSKHLNEFLEYIHTNYKTFKLNPRMFEIIWSTNCKNYFDLSRFILGITKENLKASLDLTPSIEKHSKAYFNFLQFYSNDLKLEKTYIHNVYQPILKSYETNYQLILKEKILLNKQDEIINIILNKLRDGIKIPTKTMSLLIKKLIYAGNSDELIERLIEISKEIYSEEEMIKIEVTKLRYSCFKDLNNLNLISTKLDKFSNEFRNELQAKDFLEIARTAFITKNYSKCLEFSTFTRSLLDDSIKNEQNVILNCYLIMLRGTVKVFDLVSYLETMKLILVDDLKISLKALDILKLLKNELRKIAVARNYSPSKFAEFEIDQAEIYNELVVRYAEQKTNNQMEIKRSAELVNSLLDRTFSYQKNLENIEGKVGAASQVPQAARTLPQEAEHIDEPAEPVGIQHQPVLKTCT